MSTDHKQGCEALGGYGNGVGPCSCGADNSEAMRLADYARGDEYQRAADDAVDLLRKQSARIAELETERDRLREEVERLSPNAERYEWLRDNHESDWAICEWQDDPDGLGYYRDARASHIVDAAIDAARTHKETE